MVLEFLDAVFFGNTLMQWILFMATIGIALVVGKLVDFTVIQRFKRISERSSNRFDDVLVSVIEKPLILIFLIGGLILGSFFLTIPAEQTSTFSNITGVIITIAAAWIAIRIVEAVIEKYLAPLTEATGSKIDDQLLPVINKVAKLVIIALALIAIASNFGYDVTAILAGFGIGGLAIAFAAQQTIADVFAGLSIFTSKPFVVGDFIDLNGDILKSDQIGLRHSRFRNLDGRLVTIPNSKVTGNAIVNITSEPTRKTLVNIGLTYDTPSKKLEKAKQILKEIIESDKRCEKNPIISFSEFKDSSLNILLIYYIKDKDNFLMVRDAINMKIKERFDKEKLDFAFPSQTVYLQK
ncbi:MAG: mechanosensitive ion channel family protein [Candidatus Diapherotrites archaeon]|nr:mechanosensitive ion channel family protein [Candidatus Diapherotrites archaeon]